MYYGARGIQICNRWMTFASFLDDMGTTYFEGATIDRIDNERGYEPNNCRWATAMQQSRNRKYVRRFEFNGELLTVREIAERVGINKYTLFQRLVRYTMPLDLAIKNKRISRWNGKDCAISPLSSSLTT